MIRSATLLAVAGVGLGSAGIALVVVPTIGAGLTTSTILISVLGGVALVQSVRVGVRSVRSIGSTAALSEPERRTSAPIPGQDLDSALRDRDATVRERLYAETVDILTRVDGFGRDTVEQSLAVGTWTDDDSAAAFFSSEISGPVRHRPEWLGGRPAAVRQALAVIEALADRTAPLASPRDDEGRLYRTDDGSDREPPIEPASDEDIRSSRHRSSDPENHATNHWRAIAPLTLFTIAVGILVRAPSLLLVSAVGVGLLSYAAVGRVGGDESPSLAIERDLRTADRTPGDEVPVVVTVRNVSERLLPDVRVVDGVPEGVAVERGTPRHAATLRSGGETQFAYTVTAGFGEHAFDSAIALCKDITGERERLVRLSGAGDTLLSLPPAESVPEVPGQLRTSGYVGPMPSDDGGDGIEFHTVREYRDGDPLARVDWKRLARTGELSTLEFREEKQASVVLVVDARPDAYLAPGADEQSAIGRCVEAADKLAITLLESSMRVGLTALASTPCWVPPGSGDRQRRRLRETLARNDAFDLPPSEEAVVISLGVRRLRRHLSSDTQVVLVSPLCDEDIRRFVRELQLAGSPISVVSPDPTVKRSAGSTLASVSRTARITGLRRSRTPVYDWARDEPLELALSRQPAGENR